MAKRLPSPAPDTPVHLRVLMVTPRYWPQIGGVETHVHEVARRIARPGVAVTVCATDREGRLPAVERQQGVEVRRVRAYPARRDYYFAPALYGVIARGGWDIVHCQGYHTLVAPLAMAAARRAGIPYIVSFHSGGHSAALRNGARPLQRLALRPLLAGAARLVAVSRYEAHSFGRQLRLPPERLVVIPNGAQLAPAAPAGGEACGGPLILSVGRLERYKGHHRIIGAMPRVLARHPGARLRVVGDGPYAGALRAQVAELGLGRHVEIGPIPPDDRGAMAAALARASLVTLLSDYEAHPVALMEALAIGRPVLVTNSSGLGELVEQGLARGIPPASDAEAIAAAVLDQLAHPHIPPRVALPTWEQCAEALLELYREVSRG